MYIHLTNCFGENVNNHNKNVMIAVKHLRTLCLNITPNLENCYGIIFYFNYVMSCHEDTRVN